MAIAERNQGAHAIVTSVDQAGASKDRSSRKQERITYPEHLAQDRILISQHSIRITDELQKAERAWRQQVLRATTRMPKPELTHPGKKFPGEGGT